MNRNIHFGGVFGTLILLVLMVIGFPPEPLAEAARSGRGDIPEVSKQRLVETYGKLLLSFEANVGQTSNEVKFLSRGQGYTLFLARRAEAVLVLGKPVPERTLAQPAAKPSAFVEPQPEAAPPAVLRMKLVGAKRTPQVEGLGEFPGRANYFIGNDPKKWRTNVPTYAKVCYREVYPGVDLVYYGNQRQLEHDFLVAPGTDPGSIAMAVEGAERLSLDAQGDLVVAIKGGEVRFQKPVVYQEVEGGRRKIPSRYRLKGAHQVGFQVAAYDASRPLIIDPVLSYSTYLGGSGEDIGNGIAVDSSGNAYVTGYTTSTNFPGASSSTIQSTNGGGDDAFVAKISSINCKPENNDVEGDGHEKGDDGREGEFHFCKSSGKMDFEERDRDGKIIGQPIRGQMNAVTISGNQAMITGPGTLADGTPVNYTAVVLGNQPILGANRFAISWITATGSVFQTSGALTDGDIMVQPQ